MSAILDNIEPFPEEIFLFLKGKLNLRACTAASYSRLSKSIENTFQYFLENGYLSCRANI